MKYVLIDGVNAYEGVAPDMGAWIEIDCGRRVSADDMVAPDMGAWIEIFMPLIYVVLGMASLPTWERGLK